MVQPRLMRAEEAARYLGGVSVRTVWRWVRRRTLTPVRLEGRTFFLKKDLDAAIARARRR